MDYFSRLAERALGIANDAQPVLPSRFEATAPSGPLDIEAFDEREARPTPPRSYARTDASAGPDETTPARNTVGDARAPDAGEVRPASEVTQPARSDTQPPAPTSLPMAAKLDAADVRADNSGDSREVDARPRGSAPVQVVAVRAPTPPAPTQEIFPVTPAAPISPAPSPAQPERQPATSDTSLPVAKPSIRIHIGRIEVRAIAPAPAQPAKPKRAERPAQSLEDFLRGKPR